MLFFVVPGAEGEKMLKRLCPVCGRSKLPGVPCECQRGRHRLYDKMQRDAARASFYHSGQWAQTQKAIKARAGGCDEYVKATEGRLVPADTVHHIEPLEDAPAAALALDNLILVSRRTHKRIHDHYAMGLNEKTAMQGRLREALARVRRPFEL